MTLDEAKMVIDSGRQAYKVDKMLIHGALCYSYRVSCEPAPLCHPYNQPTTFSIQYLVSQIFNSETEAVQYINLHRALTRENNEPEYYSD